MPTLVDGLEESRRFMMILHEDTLSIIATVACLPDEIRRRPQTMLGNSPILVARSRYIHTLSVVVREA